MVAHVCVSHTPTPCCPLLTVCLVVGNVNFDRVRCIDTAAQHATNKGRGISGGSGGGNGSGSSSGNFTRGRSSPVYIPESLSQAIYVPTQKITTLHPGVGAAAVAVATALSATAADGAAEGGDEEAGGGEDDVDVRLCSPALTASPALLQSVTGEVCSGAGWTVERLGEISRRCTALH